MGFWCVHLRKRDHLKDVGVNGKKILNGMRRQKWIETERRAVVNAVMNIRFI